MLVLVLSCGSALAHWTSTAVAVTNVPVTGSADDAEESATGSVSLTSTDLELVFDKSDQTVGLRFAGVTVPRGATITAAWVQFEVDETSTGSTSLTLRAQAADDAGPFQRTSRNISSRPRTAASVQWLPPSWPTRQVAGPDQRTPNIAALIREVVERPGWLAGNALALVVTGTGKRTAEAWDGTRAPVLHVEYELAANQPPSVDAGVDQQVALPASASLTGAVADDGLPNPPGATTHRWSAVSGPGTVTFADASALRTTAAFSAPGTYLLRLTASDSALGASDDLTVSVTASDTTPPSAPTSVTASAPTSARVDVAWAASSDDVGVAGYTVTRDGVVVGTTASTSYADTTVAPRTTYAYTVTARDAAGNTSPPSPTASVTTPGATSVVFAAAGDHGANAHTAASLAALDRSGADFYLALGDLDYDETATDAAWCDYVKARLPTLGPDFPFELVSGNHEEQGGPNGYILDHAACLPDRLGATLGVTGRYGAEYFFDYPASAPLVRVVMIAANLTVENETYAYRRGDPHYTWLASAIDGARAAGIPWVVVGMHEVCVSTGVKGCSTGADLQDLLLEKRVDLVLQAHEHDYQRSKQLSLAPGTCPSLPLGAYNPSCVVDDGADGAYVKGAGTVFVIDGTFGRTLAAIDPADPESAYFARTDATSWGFMRYTLSADRLDASFVASAGTLADAFSIVPAGVNSPPVADAGPYQQTTQPNAVTLSGSVDDDGQPSPPQLTHQWSTVSGPGTVTFADPAALTTTATFSQPGTYVLRLTASDSQLAASDDVTVTVVAPDAPYTLDVRVATSSDDAEEAVATGVVSRSSTDLELTTDGTTQQVVGMRFAPVGLPAGATIVNAYVQFEVDEVSTATTTLTIGGEASDNPGTFQGTAFYISSRPRTAATVAWTPPAWPTIQLAGADQRTPDLRGVVQELVDRPGWRAGNAIVILVRGSGRRTAEAFDGTSAPRLHVEYRAP